MPASATTCKLARQDPSLISRNENAFESRRVRTQPAMWISSQGSSRKSTRLINVRMHLDRLAAANCQSGSIQALWRKICRQGAKVAKGRRRGKLRCYGLWGASEWKMEIRLLLLNLASWSLVSFAGRAMRPRSADSCRDFQTANERESCGLQVVDSGSKMQPLLI